MINEQCRCGHGRNQHGDRDNRLEIVPLSMTEADREQNPPEMTRNVRGEGPCSVSGCHCRKFDAVR
jgi:hypothetical protein